MQGYALGMGMQDPLVRQLDSTSVAQETSTPLPAASQAVTDAAAAPAATPLSAEDAKRQAVSQVLANLGLTQDEMEALRDVLTRLPGQTAIRFEETISSMPMARRTVNGDALATLLKVLGAAGGDPAFQAESDIAAYLSLHADLLGLSSSQLESLVQALSSGSEVAPLMQVLENVEQSLPPAGTERERAFFLWIREFHDTLRAAAGNSEQTLAVLSRSLEGLQQIVQGSEAEQAADAQLQAQLRDGLPNSLVQALADLDKEIRAAIENIDRVTGTKVQADVDGIVAALPVVDEEQLKASMDASRHVLEFVRRFQADLSKMLEDKAPLSELRATLESAKQEIERLMTSENSALVENLPPSVSKALADVQERILTSLSLEAVRSLLLHDEKGDPVRVLRDTLKLVEQALMGDLLRSLQGIEKVLDNSLSLQQRFLEFVQLFSADLDLLQSSGLPSGDLSVMLNQALERLARDFGAVGFPALDGEVAAARVDLPPKYQLAARILETQIHTLLEMFDGSLISGATPPQTHAAGTTGRSAERVSIEAALRVLEDLFARQGKEATAVISQLSEALNLSPAGTSSIFPLLDAQARSSRPSDVFIDLLVERLRDFVRRNDPLPAGEAKTGDRQFGELVREALRELDARSNSKGQSADLGLGKKLFDEISQALRDPLALATKNSAQASQVRAFQELSTLVRGQEALQRLSPVMQALGEPAFVLFPAVIQGMFSQVELTFYPNFSKNPLDPDQSNENSKRREGKDQGERNGSDSSEDGEGEGEYFRRVQFRLTLPHLGSIGVDFAHSLKTMLLNLTVEDEATKLYLDEVSQELVSVFSSLGYGSIQYLVSKGDVQETRPAWVQEIADVRGFVA